MAGNPNFDRLTSSTMEKYIKTFEDQIFTSKPLLYIVTNFGNVETLDGGTQINQPLMYAELGNQGSYSGADTFLTNDDEGLTAAVYQWKNYYAAIKLNNDELAKNSGATAVLRIVENEVKRAELSISESLDELFFLDGSGNGGKDFSGLDAIVSATSTYGGIAVAGNDWWTSTIDTTDYAINTSGFANIRTNYLTASEGNDFPTNILTTQENYAALDATFTSNQRFMDPQLANQGFVTIMFENAPIMFDRNCQDGRIYFLNMKYITLYKLGSDWFRMSEWLEPINQDVRVKKIILRGELTCSNRKRQALMTDANPT
jgi:hypothetical protein